MRDQPPNGYDFIGEVRRCNVAKETVLLMPLIRLESEPKREINIIHFGWTGHANQYISSLKRSISGICRNDRGVSRFYIGIASGMEFDVALRRRVDKSKYSWGITDIWMLYQSKSSKSVRNLETELVDYFRRDIRLMNLARGGGGRVGTGPYHFLYLAHARDVGDWNGLTEATRDLI